MLYTNYYLEHLDEAHAVVKRRNRWCILMRRISWKARFREKMLYYPILNRWGKSIYDLYEEKHPEVRFKSAMCAVWVSPMMRRVGYEDLAKQIIKIEPLEKKDE
jgi:hypothetical protein